MLATGDTIGHYRILAKLGEGGMGIVFRAHDTRLLREVAIKCLSPHLVINEKSRQRFMHEARTASALNHSNICTIYDIGQVDAAYYIVMESLQGETLRKILQQRGFMSEKEVINICRQICQALAAAHARGIVHRDIKPDNIMLLADGQVKIMDFGLAKLTGRPRKIANAGWQHGKRDSHADTFKTSQSTLEGTALYMAPEQIDKCAVDARTDIYAMGAMMYELVTGRPPFQADDELELMTTILHERAEPPKQYRAGLSPAMNNLILRALNKNPAERQQTIVELKDELDEIVKPGDRKASFRTLYWLTAIAIMVLCFMVILFFDREKKPHALSNLRMKKLDLSGDLLHSAIFSPDGRRIAFCSADAETGSQSIRLFEPERGKETIVLEQSGGAPALEIGAIDWSPDGRRLAVQKREGGICLLDLSESSALKALSDFGYEPAWSPDGSMIAFSHQAPYLVWEDNKIWIFHLADSSFQKASPDNLRSYDSPTWSPDGRWLACLGGVGSEKALWLLDIDTGEARQILYWQAGISKPKWSGCGDYLYFLSQDEKFTLYRVQVSLTDGQLISGPEEILTNWQVSDFDISKDGKKLLYRAGELQQEVLRLGIDDLSWDKAELLSTVPFMIGNITVAPDGNTAAIEAIAAGGRPIRLLDLRRGKQKDIYARQAAYAPCWSPDGEHIVFDAGGGNNADIWQAPAAGGSAQKIIANPGADWMPTYSPAGKHICFLSNKGGQFDLWLFSTATGECSQITNTPETESGGYWSHDGRRLAFFRNAAAGDSAAVWLYDLATGAEHRVFTFRNKELDILTKIVWRSDGSSIYFSDGHGLAEVSLKDKKLRYLFGSDMRIFKYDVWRDHLYIVRNVPATMNFWLAEGLE